MQADPKPLPRVLAVLLWALSLPLTAYGQSAPQSPAPTKRARTTHIARSADGLVFRDSGALQSPNLASPGLMRLGDGQLLAVFDRDSGVAGSSASLVVSRSNDQGHAWSEPKPIQLDWTGPTPELCTHGEWLAAPGGAVRLYFITAGRVAAQVQESPAVKVMVRCAVTRDGTSYRFDPTVQIPLEEGVPPHLVALELARETHLMLPRTRSDAKAQHFVSTNGRPFQPSPPPVPPDMDNVRSIVAVEGGYRAYVAAEDAVRSLFSTDGSTWAAELGIRLAGRWDPAVVRLADGSFLMLYSPRPADDVQTSGMGGLAGLLSPSSSGRAEVLRDRTTSAKKLHKLAISCLMYAADHGGALPPDLQTLVQSGAITADALVSPFEADAYGVSYIYIEGQTHTMDPRNVVAYEKLENHEGEGTMVMFLDGHVQWLKPEAFEKTLAETSARLGR